MWIRTGVTVRKRLSWVVTSVTLTFDLWPWSFAWTLPWSVVITPENFMMIRWWEHSQKGVTDRQTDGQTDRQTENTIHRAAWSQLKTIGHLFYATSSFVHHFVAIGEFKLELQSGNAQSGSNSTILEPCDLEIWQMTLKNNRAPPLSNIKLYTSFHHHMWIQTGVTVRKRLSWTVTSVILNFDLWPWPFAWTSLLSLVITPENFMMIRWWEHSEKGVTDRQTDRQTDGRTENTIHRAAWSQLKTIRHLFYASFHSHLWIQTGDKVRKHPIWVKIDDFFLAVWPWNLTDDLENQQDTAPKQYQAWCIISSPYVKSNWSYGPKTANFIFLFLPL